MFFLTVWSYSSATGAIAHKDRFELNVGSELPFYMGAQLKYDISSQYYFKLSSGFAMQFLMKSYQNILESLGYTENTASVIEALFNSFVSDVRMGWAINVNEGLFVELGYYLMVWGKGQINQKVIDEVLNINSDDISSAESVYIHTLHHGPLLSIGYKITLIDKLSLNLAVSGYKPLFSHASLEYSAHSTSIVNGATDTVSAQLENHALDASHNEVIDNIFVNKLFFVSLGVWFGLRF